jgi:hypothetical protein
MPDTRITPSRPRRWSLLAAATAGLAVAAAPAPAPAATGAAFIVAGVGDCEMSTQTVGCLTLFNPISNTFSVTLNRRGHIKVCQGCFGDPGEDTPTLKPGHSRRVGRFRCTAHTRSITCKIIRTGKGFRMTTRHVTRIG